jgi:hypothetical protein
MAAFFHFCGGYFIIDDKVRIKCTKCSQVFRERGSEGQA